MADITLKYFFSRLIPALLTVGLFASCGGPPNAIIGIGETEPSQTARSVRSHDIYVLTTRAPASDGAIMYSGGRGAGLSKSRVTVTIPPNHAPGKIERPKRLPPDPERNFTIVEPQTYARDSDFVSAVNSALRARPPSERSILVFVHGFNTDFTSAVLRMGQLVEDTGFKGVPVLFSWASHGKLLDYVYDLNSALSARDELLEADRIILQTEARAYNIVAHSMGNLLTVEALKQAKLINKFNTSGTLNNVILASADIDVDVFVDQISVFEPDERKFYLLISADDKALAASRLIAGGVNRVGDEDAHRLAQLGVTVIDLSEVSDTNSINHTKFADSPEVVQLMGQQIMSNGGLSTGSSGRSSITNAIVGLGNALTTTVSGGGSVIVIP